MKIILNISLFSIISVIINYLINKRKFDTIKKIQKVQNKHEKNLKEQIDETEKMKEEYKLKIKEVELDLKTQVDATKEMEKKYEFEIEKIKLQKENDLNPNELIKNPDIVKLMLELIQDPKKLENITKFNK